MLAKEKYPFCFYVLQLVKVVPIMLIALSTASMQVYASHAGSITNKWTHAANDVKASSINEAGSECFVPIFGWQQARIKLHGNVTDSATGKPMAGVTVQVKGSTTFLCFHYI